jgi:type IV pilus assembly protein PilC
MRNFPILLVLLEFLVCPLVVSFVLVMIVPKFQDIYAQLGGELPLSTLWLIRGSDLLFHQFHWILVAALLLAILVLRFRMKAGFRTAVLKTVPGLRVAAWSPALSRFSFALGELLQAGIGLESAMRLAVKAAGNTILRDREELMVKQLENGKPLDHVLGEVPTIPARYLWMVSRGVKRERPGETLVGLADGCRRDFESFLFGLTSTVFPLLVVLLGAMVLFCVVALYEPLFNIPRIVGRE